QQGDQQQGENHKQLPEGQKAALMKLATKNGGLSRRDVRDRTQMPPQPTSPQEPNRSPLFSNEAPAVYRQIGAVIANRYQQSSEIRPEPSLNISL
ncbi:MAG: hypothetical protein LPD71_14355, partial [Shewanella sp.]|nr:hypothetical protein [Shewanella sp.]